MFWSSEGKTERGRVNGSATGGIGVVPVQM